MKDKQHFEDIDFSGDFALDPVAALKKHPKYDYGAIIRYAKSHNKAYTELTREEIEQFRLPD